MIRMNQQLGVVLAVSLFVIGVNSAQAERYEIDPTHTVVAFLIDHVGYSRVLGRFDELAGTLEYDVNSRTLKQLDVVVDTASVESGNEARDKHVRNRDFLNVSKYPTMRFVADATTFDSDEGGAVSGTLTLLGVSRPLTLDVTINKGAVYPFGHKRFTLGASARGTLNRSDYGMQYGVANALVGDEVELIIEIEAPQAK